MDGVAQGTDCEALRHEGDAGSRSDGLNSANMLAHPRSRPFHSRQDLWGKVSDNSIKVREASLPSRGVVQAEKRGVWAG